MTKNFIIRVLGCVSIVAGLILAIIFLRIGCSYIYNWKEGLFFSLFIISGLGLLGLKNWARRLLILQMGWIVATRLWSLIDKIFLWPLEDDDVLSYKPEVFFWLYTDRYYVGLILVLTFFIYYLNRLEIKKQFQ